MMDIALVDKEKKMMVLRDNIPMVKKTNERRLKILELFQKKMRSGKNEAHLSEIFNAIYGDHKQYKSQQIWDMTSLIIKDMRFFRLKSEKFAFIKGDGDSMYKIPMTMEETENYTDTMDEIAKRCRYMKKRIIRYVKDKEYHNFDGNVERFKREINPIKMLR
jgi:hypothetical protein